MAYGPYSPLLGPPSKKRTMDLGMLTSCLSLNVLLLSESSLLLPLLTLRFKVQGRNMIRWLGMENRSFDKDVGYSRDYFAVSAFVLMSAAKGSAAKVGSSCSLRLQLMLCCGLLLFGVIIR